MEHPNILGILADALLLAISYGRCFADVSLPAQG